MVARTCRWPGFDEAVRMTFAEEFLEESIEC